eukprot:TRINITY_DN78414_c0_g1_i1.p1 TRINITY_DN78414_c0_g1~~TRINITY_DN78414_c0_g1_i1.p1  ORF type:complete len:115 (+),score=57.52 TRINITY_DN78414_c0_g1_i1:327-671(+)
MEQQQQQPFMSPPLTPQAPFGFAPPLPPQQLGFNPSSFFPPQPPTGAFISQQQQQQQQQQTGPSSFSGGSSIAGSDAGSSIAHSHVGLSPMANSFMPAQTSSTANDSFMSGFGI